MLEDSNYVIDEIDPKNTKALFRRAIAHKSAKHYQKAADDLKTLIKIQASKEAVQELDAITKLMKETAPQVKKDAPKIEEIHDDDEDEMPPLEEIETPDSPASGEWQKDALADKAPAKPTHTKKAVLENEDVKKLREEIAAQTLPVPKTATELERDYNSLKK